MPNKKSTICTFRRVGDGFEIKENYILHVVYFKDKKAIFEILCASREEYQSAFNCRQE